MLYVLLAVVLLAVLVIVLLNVSINLFVHYDDENQLKCTLSYLFLSFTLYPEEEAKKNKKEEKNLKKIKKNKKKGKTAEKKDSKISLKGMFKEKGIRAFLEDIKVIVKSLWSLIMSVTSRCTLKQFDFNMNVAGDDAADTAIIFGYANAIIYPIASAVIDNVAECEDHNIVITPDFSENPEASVNFDIHLAIKPVKLLGAIVENRESAENLLNAIK